MTLASEAIQHWKEFQPSRYADLRANGTLQGEAEAAVELTSRMTASLRAAGASQHEAWEQARGAYLFPPQEAGLPEESLPQSAAHEATKEMQRLAQSLNDDD